MSTKPALPWLRKLCSLYERHDNSVFACTAEPHPNGVLVSLELDRGKMYLLIQSKGSAKFYAETASMCISIHQPADAGPAPGNGELVARQFIGILSRADKGDVEVTSRCTQSPAPTATAIRVSDADARAARDAAADEIKWASFLAYKAIVTEDLYPHVGPLGELVDEQEILDGWRATVKRIANKTAPPKLGLYVHAPFCTVACTFCYCGKTDKFNRSMMETYLKKLHKEIELFAPIFTESTFTSVYFGGGTPSLFSPPAMRELFSSLYGALHVPDGTQIIFEGNPDSLSEAKIKVLANEGRVTRLTIGVQTLDDTVQAIVKRFNTPDQVASAIAAARHHEIEHVNCDLMAGMPEQTLESFQKDVEFLLTLEPDSLHLNGYRPLPRTQLGGSSPPMPEAQIKLRDEMLQWGQERLKQEGHRDESGQGQRRTRNAANIQEYDLRRQNSSLLGLGYSARSHSFGSHFYSPDSSGGFDAGLNQDLNGERRWRAVQVDTREEQHKYLVSNFRTGFDKAEFQALFGEDVAGVVPKRLEKLMNMGMVSMDDDRVNTHVNSPLEDLTFRTFLYSDKHLERATKVWGHEYDPDFDYTTQLRRLTEATG